MSPPNQLATPDRPRPAAVPDPADAEAARWRRILGGEIAPTDYLPVTPEVTRAVEAALAFARTRLGGQEPDDAVRVKLLQDYTIGVHHGGRMVATLRRPDGVIALAVGLDEVGRLVRTLPPGSRSGFAIEHPPSW